MNDDSRFTETVPAEVANRAINDALQFAPTPGAALSPDYAELRKLAEAATPGSWAQKNKTIPYVWATDKEHGYLVHQMPIGDDAADFHPDTRATWLKDAAYIAAANPAAILSLLDAIESQRAALSPDAKDAEIARLEAENAAIREAMADEVSAATMLTKFSMESGSLDIVYEGGACQLLAETLGKQFREKGGPNFMEMGFHCQDGLDLIVTIQRANGKTPAMLRTEAEDNLAAALLKIEELSDAAHVSAPTAAAKRPLYTPAPRIDLSRNNHVGRGLRLAEAIAAEQIAARGPADSSAAPSEAIASAGPAPGVMLNRFIDSQPLPVFAAPSPAGESLSAEPVAWLYEWSTGHEIFFGKEPICPNSEAYFDFIPPGSTATPLGRIATHRQPEDGAALLEVAAKIVENLNVDDEHKYLPGNVAYELDKAAREIRAITLSPTATKEASVQGVPYGGSSAMPAATGTIPTDVFYAAEHDNFYYVSTHGGCGIKFYQKWRARRAEFPQGAPPQGESK